MQSVTSTGVFLTIVKRDLRLAWRQRSEIANALGFLLVIISLFPLALGPQAALLQQIAPGVIWIAALLCAMLSLDQIFRSDFEDGALEQMLVSPVPLALIALAKSLAHWIVASIPVLAIAPLLALMLQMEMASAVTLMMTMALGTPVISLLGAIGSALTVAHRRGGALLAMLVLPLLIPVLILSTSAVDATQTALPTASYFYLLGALLVLSLTLAPLAIAAAIKLNLE